MPCQLHTVVTGLLCFVEEVQSPLSYRSSGSFANRFVVRQFTVWMPPARDRLADWSLCALCANTIGPQQSGQLVSRRGGLVTVTPRAQPTAKAHCRGRWGAAGDRGNVTEPITQTGDEASRDWECSLSWAMTERLEKP